MPVQPPASEGSIYRERLLPGPMWWVVAAALVAMIAVAYGAALGSGIGAVVGVGLGLIAVVILVRTSPRVDVSDTTIRCGRAYLPREQVDSVRRVDGTDLVAIRRGLDRLVGDRVYLVLPAWLSTSAVLVTLHDAADPHDAWLIATRHPDGLVATLSTPIEDR